MFCGINYKNKISTTTTALTHYINKGCTNNFKTNAKLSVRFLIKINNILFCPKSFYDREPITNTGSL